MYGECVGKRIMFCRKCRNHDIEKVLSMWEYGKYRKIFLEEYIEREKRNDNCFNDCT